MPTESERSLAGKKAAKTKGPQMLAEAGSEAVSTKTIRKAMKHLAAISAELEAVQQLLGNVESKEQRAKRPPKRKRQSR